MGNASFIIGVVALVLGVVTLPAAFQMFFGGPAIVWEYCSEQGEENSLCIVLRNKPVQSDILVKIGVLRQDANIRCSYTVTDINNTLLDSGTQPLKISNGHPAITGKLAEHDWAILECVRQERHSKKAFCGEPDLGTHFMAPGVYNYRLNLYTSGKKLFIDRNFAVFEDQLAWLCEDGLPFLPTSAHNA